MTGAGSGHRRIGLFTSGRQDWGYLQPVARAAADREGLDVTVFISGTHLHPAYGGTHREIRVAGVRCVNVPLARPGGDPGDTEIDPADLAGMAGRLVEAMRANPVDIMVVVGDRIETLTAAVMVVADRRFLAHVHGGDRAQGEYDDANRHAITKLAHLHLAATPAAAERIARLGEPADRIRMVGSPGIDSIVAEPLPTAAEVRELAGLPAKGPFALLLLHPAGLGDAGEAAAAEEVCQGIVNADVTAVCLGPNADAGRDAIWGALRDFSSRRNWPICPSVARRAFLGLMREAVALVGNSSAGMIESAAVGAAVLNIGPRQSGREHSGNVVHLPAEREAIGGVLRRLTDEPAFAAELRSAKCIYGDGRAASRIVAELAGMGLADCRRTKLIEY